MHKTRLASRPLSVALHLVNRDFQQVVSVQHVQFIDCAEVDAYNMAL
jgi:hypothetical protein